MIPNLATGYEYKHAPFSGAHFFNLDTYAEDSEHDEDFLPDLQINEATSTA